MSKFFLEKGENLIATTERRSQWLLGRVAFWRLVFSLFNASYTFGALVCMFL